MPEYSVRVRGEDDRWTDRRYEAVSARAAAAAARSEGYDVGAVANRDPSTRLGPAAPDEAGVTACERCGYDLEGVRSDARGVLVCPECGRRLLRSRRRAWEMAGLGERASAAALVASIIGCALALVSVFVGLGTLESRVFYWTGMLFCAFGVGFGLRGVVVEESGIGAAAALVGMAPAGMTLVIWLEHVFVV